jgi:beta-barrel assembly-enhancing protease
MRRLAPASLLILWLSSAIPAAAVTPSSLEALRAQDGRVAAVAYRLLTANLALCDTRAPQTGFAIHDAQQYAPSVREDAMRHFGLGAEPAVLTVAPGSPAERAGLRKDDALIAISGQRLVAELPRGKASFVGVERATALLDRAFASGSAVLTVRRNGAVAEVTVTPEPGCASRVALIPSTQLNAAADGIHVQLTSAIADYAANDDELAAVIAHELAHNILRHRATLDAAGVPSGFFRKLGKNAARVRATEEEADHVGLYLLAHAGYDLEAALAFWQRFGRDHGAGIFADATHPSWRAREAQMRLTIERIAAQRARGEPLAPGEVPGRKDSRSATSIPSPRSGAQGATAH